ncbi:RND transporter [Nocardioides sp. NPDC051685]|uniref:RND transporter n=1 Tax=Nocardioides sp. NPDC051685 TaxID=3364334 RepID=UPI003795D406
MKAHNHETTAGGRRWRLALVALGVGAAVVAGLFRVELTTSTESFLPSSDPVQRAFSSKSDDFGGDPLVVLLETEQPRALFSEQEQLLRLVGLEGELAKIRDVAAVYGPGTVLNQTAGAAQDMLAQISGRRDGYRNEVMAAARKKGLSKPEVEELGRAAVARFDERYGTLLVRGMPAGLPTLKNPRFVQTILFDEETLAARPRWRYLIPSPTTVAVLVRPRADLDAAGTSRLVDRVESTVTKADLDVSRTTVTGSPAIAAGLADRGRSEFPLLGATAIGAVGIIFLLLKWTRRRRDRMRPIVAALIGTATTIAGFGWLGHPVSLGVVAFLPILMGIGSDFPLYWSRGKADRAVLVATGAAVVGFASVGLSPLPFVRELGLALAAGIVFTVTAAVVMRHLLGPVPPPDGVSEGARELPSFSPRVRALAALCIFASAVVGWSALAGLRVESQPDKLAEGLPELAAARYAEETLGSNGEVTVVIDGSKVTAPEVLAWSREAQRRIVTELGDRVHPVLSIGDLLSFLGAEPTAAQVDAAVDAIPPYLSSAVLRSDREQSLIVLGVEFEGVDELGVLLEDLDEAIGDPPAGVDVEVVGLPVSAARGLEVVSSGRILINLVGIASATLVILVGLRSFRDAARALATIVVATGWVGLIASITTGSLSPLTVALGSLVVATGSEFAIMLRRGDGVRAVATAALAGTVGYLVLALSELAVLRDFGLLLAAGVACSFAAALVVDRILWPDTPAVDAMSNAATTHQPDATQTVIAPQRTAEEVVS